MSNLKNSLRETCRAALRPLAHVVRRALTVPPPPREFRWHEITAGPAAGCQALLPDGSAIAAAITAGTFEQTGVDVIGELVRKGDDCFDIGGHYGYYTLALAKLSESGQIHTFDPVAAHADRIRQAAEHSGLSNVTVHPLAVAGEVGEMSLRYADSPGGDDSMAYLESYGGVDTEAAREHYQGFATTTVRTVTLDAVDAPHPKLIKIDAEGAEAPILRGGRNLIAAAQPRLLIELHGIYEALQCAEVLDGLNYRAILLTKQKTTLPILWAPRDDDEAVAGVRRAVGHEPVLLFDHPRGIAAAANQVVDGQ